MRYAQLGKTDLRVSRICLGCASFGDPDRGGHGWTLSEEASRPILRVAIEAGINFFDTANIYSDGASEEIVGRAIRDFTRRDQVVIATKCGGSYSRQGIGGGLSRTAILTAIDDSLRRLGTDHIDLYQIHRLDPATPIEETLSALDEAVRIGKARYIGASSMAAWQFAKLLHLADQSGWARMVSMQNHLNLLYREEEREMLPLCRDEGIAVMPWSPLARGRLTRDWEAVTDRSATDRYGKRLYRDTEAADREVAEAVTQVAARRGVQRAQIALAWLLGVDGVTAPIVGATQADHVIDAVAALDIQLSADERQAMEAPYVAHPVAGFD